MNADAFRQLYDYHFTENRKIWDNFITPLSDEQFTQPVAYSVGSLHNQTVHLMSCDDYWFSGLRGLDMLDPSTFADRQSIRERWNNIEQNMRAYLATLTDDALFAHPLSGGDEILCVWQILLQVSHHGVDHRAQILRALSDLGVKTNEQDYIFYVFNHLATGYPYASAEAPLPPHTAQSQPSSRMGEGWGEVCKIPCATPSSSLPPHSSQPHNSIDDLQSIV